MEPGCACLGMDTLVTLPMPKRKNESTAATPAAASTRGCGRQAQAGVAARAVVRVAAATVVAAKAAVRAAVVKVAAARVAAAKVVAARAVVRVASRVAADMEARTRVPRPYR